MTNKCNMKRLQINAQVTAMTTLIEHIGNVTSLIVTIHFTTNFSWFLSRLILEMLFYCIIVPHSFLMNTSDNKNRIMEYGWKGVFQNLIGRRRNKIAASPNCDKENRQTGFALYKYGTFTRWGWGKRRQVWCDKFSVCRGSQRWGDWTLWPYLPPPPLPPACHRHQMTRGEWQLHANSGAGEPDRGE